MISQPKKKRQERQLLSFFKQMNSDSQQSLLDFASFLVDRGDPVEEHSPTLQDIPRPDNESVVKAIKRLVATYPMLDRSEMLNETSALMTEHVMQGRAASEVIDELESVFRKHHEQFLS
ncbi:MAG: Crp/Fnr family transcriptional regulator [Thiothrix sp.]|nr:MAG: Crp/Fnr family transcriptional regulator [Thiothrix sp.]